jgi:hypothetical protein
MKLQLSTGTRAGQTRERQTCSAQNVQMKKFSAFSSQKRTALRASHDFRAARPD